MIAALADAGLAVKHRAAGFQPDRQRHQQHRRPGDQQQDDRRRQVEEALAQPARRGVIEAAGEHQPGGIHDVQLDHARFAFEEGGQIDDGHAALHAQQHLFHRQAATALVRRDHQFVDLQALDQFGQPLFGGNQQIFLDQRRLAGNRNKTDHGERAAIGLAPHPAVDQIRVLARAEYQHPLLERVGVQRGHDESAEQHHQQQ